PQFVRRSFRRAEPSGCPHGRTAADPLQRQRSIHLLKPVGPPYRPSNADRRRSVPPTPQRPCTKNDGRRGGTLGKKLKPWSPPRRPERRQTQIRDEQGGRS